ncbi:MAG: hypothetical protein GY811_23920 [Myxococcales bacterium]|nr:hypothetical protein [Myxococcales bacterium]
MGCSGQVALLSSVLFAFGCGADGTNNPGGGGGDYDARPAASTPDASSPDASSPDAGRQISEVVRFIAMGDTGTGSASQYKVGNEVANICATRGCDFVVLLGDNFYDAGVAGVSDPLWQDYFEMPYAAIPDTVPFYPVLGNHDYGGSYLLVDFDGLGNDFEKGAYEVNYSDQSDKWTMPATFYTLRVGSVGFMMLDTNSIMWGNTDNGDQEAWYAGARAELDDAEWVFAAGHHPYRSNGRHGNAGSYESIEVLDMPIPNPVELLNGNAIKAFFDTHVCGTVDAYFCGHDHNLQWIDEPDALCGAQLIVSGAGAKTTDFESTTNNSLYEDDQKPGFVYAVIEGDTMTLEFIDEDGEVDFVQSVVHP